MDMWSSLILQVLSVMPLTTWVKCRLLLQTLASSNRLLGITKLKGRENALSF